MAEQTPKWKHVKALKTVVMSDFPTKYPVAQYVDFENGRLIACAPEMLAMLEKIADVIVTPSWVPDEIKELIAKAKGL